VASACGSVNGKVERRRRDAGTEPQRNDRHRTAGGKAADPSASGNAARDERAFLRSGTGAVVRGLGRTAAGEEQQECALVTAVSLCVLDDNADCRLSLLQIAFMEES